ncbi:hypothetical protein CONPUDRAFT_86456 [Coniophora puteana RWD-64-598 SS2]|uniref:Amino acid transporter transmembrane domain-containing protein n=1 Tax=Coniophora puteana (strain RWD-64-598) TaxID=741705 RepID=A0A5M3N5F9_CONPW|nr:uncharacterized protein CONPUDRAFT_86456 [Coniophora puteana RWD-64-598 SS2]EIW86487.1 hypothetical protein CONPUDRAFT_86456 [Coniophora puteana RWD-64-598 SS2]
MHDQTDKPSATSKTEDVFVEVETHQIHYKTLSWQLLAFLMIAEIVSNGMLSLPSTLAIVGIVPAVIVQTFLGIFALYTAKLLIDFKLNHPEVHNMGDAGLIIFGPLGREVLSLGTVVFAVFAAGSELLSGQQALSTLSDKGLCSVYFVLIMAAVSFVVALPRTLDGLSWLGMLSAILIALTGVLAMIGAGLNPVEGRVINVTISASFYEAFLAITNPVFSYAGTHRFFILISEMKEPRDAMKAAWCLQTFATIFYVVFSVVLYVYIGNTVQSPALFSLPPIWAKVTFGVALGNFIFSAAICSHTAAKLVFIRLFRHSHHLYSHTLLGWGVWTLLCLAAIVAAFILAVAVPVFSYLIGIAASLFAAWYTYGIAGAFWLHDTYHIEGGFAALRRRPLGTALASSTVLAGAFICVAGTYVSIKTRTGPRAACGITPS